MDKDAYYFPHFCNARHDRKIKRVRKELGLEGYGIFFMLLETLREQADYKYPIEDIDLLADEYGTSEQKVRAVIANYDLFQHDDTEHFFSSNLIMYLQPYLQAKEARKIAGIKGNLIRWKHYTKEQIDKMTPEQIIEASSLLSLSDSLGIAEQSQVKESKVKKSKPKESKHKHGEYKHVLLTDSEYEKLNDKLKNRDTMIHKMDRAIEMKGYKYKSHYLAILDWAERDGQKKPEEIKKTKEYYTEGWDG